MSDNFKIAGLALALFTPAVAALWSLWVFKAGANDSLWIGLAYATGVSATCIGNVALYFWAIGAGPDE